jgi:DnaJ-class molecular chaperone
LRSEGSRLRDPLGLFDLDDAAFEARLQHLSFYTLLQVGREASHEEIVNAHRSVAACYHQDKPRNRNYSAPERLNTITVCLNTAKATLCDPAEREKYDLKQDQDPFEHDEAAAAPTAFDLLTSNRERPSAAIRAAFEQHLQEYTRSQGRLSVVDNSADFLNQDAR